MYTAFFVSDGQIAGVAVQNSSGETGGNNITFYAYIKNKYQ